jgi:hypothetical protein
MKLQNLIHILIGIVCIGLLPGGNTAAGQNRVSSASPFAVGGAATHETGAADSQAGVPEIETVSSDVAPTSPEAINLFYFPYAYYVGGGWYWDNQIGYIYPYSNGVCYFSSYGRFYYPGGGQFDYSTGVYIWDYFYGSWTYTAKNIWPWVYYYSFGQWFSNGFN